MQANDIMNVANGIVEVFVRTSNPCNVHYVYILIGLSVSTLLDLWSILVN